MASHSLSIPPTLQELIPKDAASTAALNLAINHLSTPILNHSLRVYFYAHKLATTSSSSSPAYSQLLEKGWKAPPIPLLFVASVLHDIGTCEIFNGPQRFEIEGADAAKALLLEHGWSEEDAHQAWIAIAVHDSPQIAERIYPLSKLVRVAVKIDFGKSDSAHQKWDLEGLAAEIEAEGVLPRLEAEKCLADAVVAQAKEWPGEELRGKELKAWTSDKHPRNTWPGELLKAKVEWPDHEGVNPAF